MLHRLFPPPLDLDTTFDRDLERYPSPTLMPASAPARFSAKLMQQIGHECLDGNVWHRRSMTHYCPVTIAPLSERDVQAMTILFEVEGITDFETDIEQMLLSLVPEPCWDEDLVQ